MLTKSSTRATDLNTLFLSDQAMGGESHHSLAIQSEQHHNQESKSNQIITISEVVDGLEHNMAKQVSTNIVDVAVSVRIGDTSNDVEQDNNTKMTIVKASMSTLPTDVVMRIFEALPHATAACLGLTCRGLYACLNPKKPIDCRYQKFESRLPNPYNKGHDWFPEAIEAIEADVTRFENIGEWKIFWSSFNVFHNNKKTFDDFFDECILDQMSEFFKLLGL